MKRFSKLWVMLIASMAVLVVAACVGTGLEAQAVDGTLSCCVDWLKSWTGHTDGLMLAAGGAAAVPAEVKELAESLKKLQHDQEEMEDRIQSNIKKDLGVAELTESFSKMNKDVGDIVTKVDNVSAKLAKEATEREEIVAKLNGRIDEYEKKYEGKDGDPGRPDTPGRLFLKSEQYQEASKRGARMVEKVHIGMFPLRAMKQLSNFTFPDSMKALSSDAESAAALRDSLRIPGVLTEPDITLNVQDLIPTTVIEEGVVDWVREDDTSENTTVVGGAGVVAESTTGSLNQKPEVDIEFTLVEKPLRTIAAWIAASKQILKDSRRTQLRSYIDRRLMYAVDLELEDQILLGDGTGQNLDGLIPTAADYNQGYAQIQGAAPTKMDILRRAKTQARLAEYPVTGYVLHPTDWADIELTKGSDLHYIFAQPGIVTVPRLWGVPIADSTRMTEGEFLVGAFSLGAELFTQGDSTIEIATQHASFFTANMVAILAEMRALLAVYRPKAFVSGTYLAGSGSGS